MYYTSCINRLFRNVRTGIEPLLCFILPLSTWFFLSTAPHAWDSALMWTLPVWLCIVADYFSPSDCRMPKTTGMEWLLDARLYLLFSLQILNIALLLDAASSLAWRTLPDFATGSANIVAMRILAGTTSCCSGFAVAHELLHRRAKHLRWMGRILLWSVCYDHFALEHAHGHHRMVGTRADPATARLGESFADFFKRSVLGQWSGAWRMENQRLQHRKGIALLLRHRVLQGVMAELAILMLITLNYGMVALIVFLYQAVVAVRMLEAVNYLHHWGLSRRDTQYSIAWTTDSWFTLHSFIGLSRHADHHAHSAKPCYQLRHSMQGPRLPHGYFVMIMLLRLSNEHYLRLAERELTGLSPHAAFHV